MLMKVGLYAIGRSMMQGIRKRSVLAGLQVKILKLDFKRLAVFERD